MMLIVLLILLSLTLFILLSPLRVELDTNEPVVRIRWWGIGRAELFHEGEWKARLRVLFFKKVLYLERKHSASRKKQLKRNNKATVQKRKAAKPFRVILFRILRVARSFTVEQWRLDIDTGDAAVNARLYPLNWLPLMRGHVFVNFNGEQRFQCRIRNNGWRMARAWFHL